VENHQCAVGVQDLPAMNVLFLGNGGFIGNGIPYNAFVIDGTFLVESPPDIMGTLRAQGVDYRGIRRIYLSHFHGDHCFGMPFLTLNLMNQQMETGRAEEPIDIISPRGAREHLVQLQITAVSADNPSVKWIDTGYRFTGVDDSSRVDLGGGRTMVFHRMSHSKETYGFTIMEGGACALTYLADTLWDDSFIPVLSRKPRCVIADLNSVPGDKIMMHMSEKDILEKAMPLTGDATKYIGTHLRADRVSHHKNLIYATPGLRVEV
jgi:glyoxylase-like metal-dependent hydrolase (beta-lactamase superfamily II)